MYLLSGYGDMVVYHYALGEAVDLRREQVA